MALFPKSFAITLPCHLMTSTIGLRTGTFARWVSFIGYACGLVLLLVIGNFAWIALLFPLWVLLVSTYILYADCRKNEAG